MTVTILAPALTPEPHATRHSGDDAQDVNDRAVRREIYPEGVNPVLETSQWAMKTLNIVTLNEEGIASAARYIRAQMRSDSYTPRTWRTHPLHLCPAEPFAWADPSTRATLDWIFLISSLNFSFWSEREGQRGRYGVEWHEGWAERGATVVHTGYWSLVAAIDRALEEGIPITDPAFYASETRCPDRLIEHVFRPAPQSVERIPLLKERIAVLRRNGAVLCEKFDGSFHGFVNAFRKRHNDCGTTLQLVKMVTDSFSSFRDETIYQGRRIYLWKRAQILVAETWAAFYPAPTGASSPSRAPVHPLFPGPLGASIHELTMFADYRVPQILHHLRILTYPPPLAKLLRAHVHLAPGAPEEVAIRAASIVGVERVRREILRLAREEQGAQEELENGDSSGDGETAGDEEVSSVLIDFYLWDLAKLAEGWEDGVGGVETVPMLPIHRTRSIWY
ncbi:hypothetical protein BC628DRAFT_1535128 [Trametes gibbosa]|nr:hypothetical protein BC628DRAFT_1535128 [Trametes gibbosa]